MFKLSDCDGNLVKVFNTYDDAVYYGNTEGYDVNGYIDELTIEDAKIVTVKDCISDDILLNDMDLDVLALPVSTVCGYGAVSLIFKMEAMLTEMQDISFTAKKAIIHAVSVQSTILLKA